MKATINLFGVKCNVTPQCNNYREGNALAVSLIDEEGSLFATISVNFPPHSAKLPLGVFYCKDWSENEAIIPQLVEQGLIKRRDEFPPIQSGFITSNAYELIVK